MRNASLQDLAEHLRDEHSRKIDLVAPATCLTAVGGLIRVTGSEPIIDLDGVTEGDGLYLPTSGMDAQIADRLNIPLAYLRRLRTDRIDLYDINVNAWLHGRGEDGYHEFGAVDPDPRNFLFRGFRADGGVGVGRALLSDVFSIVDHIDVLTATLDGVRASGVAVEVTSCDLSENRMVVKVAAPAVAALAPTLLKGYRSPYSGNSGDENPTVFAGFIIANSEVGGGAFTIIPQLTVQVCTNGMTMTKDALRKVHLGSRLEQGIVRWSQDTQRKNLDVITAQARDAVATFLDIDYVRRSIEKLEQAAGAELRDPQTVVTAACKQVGYSEEFTASVFDHFIRGGQMTAGGVLQAVTSAVQLVDDVDDAFEISTKAIAAMEFAASAR